MSLLVSFLNGEVTTVELRKSLYNCSELREELNNLIPSESKNHPEHEIWKRYAYSALKPYNFILSEYLTRETLAFKFNGSLGDNLNIWSVVEHFFNYNHPDFEPKATYRERFGLYLDVMSNKFEGPEVRTHIESIIDEAYTKPTKKERKAEAKARISEDFKCYGKKPYWIQGAEWPMGTKRPMIFVSQEKKGEYVDYIFEDVDTKEKRVIRQFY